MYDIVMRDLSSYPTSIASSANDPFLLSTKTIFKYKKIITYQEQMIPLFFCLPNRGTPVTTSPLIYYGEPHVKEWLPETHKLLASLTPWCRKLMIDMINHLWSGAVGGSSQLTDYLQGRRRYSSDSRKAVIMYLTRALNRYRANTSVRAQYEANQRGAFDRLIPIDGWNPVGKTYGLPAPANPHAFRDRALPAMNSIVSGSFLTGWTTQLDASSPLLGITKAIIRYGYAGFEHKGLRDSVNTVMRTRAETDFNFSPYYSVMHGITSLYCVMVRATEYEKIVKSCILGKLEGMELPKGAIELWEQKGVKELLGPREFKIYKEEVYALVRNTHGCPVRTFDNLTQELFDLPKPVDVTDYDRQASIALSRGTIILSESAHGSLRQSKYERAHILR